MHILAPAKVNVFLRITGRRLDGYHLLDSLMVPISLCDEINLEAWNVDRETGNDKEIITVMCDDPTLPTDETNLVYKAARLLCKEAEIKARIAIDLRKRIPAGAGLGGGSSDAAAVLKGLNTLLTVGFDDPRLCRLAVRLGADVPFFILCRPARVQGIGEILTPVSALPSKWFVVVVPPFGVLTKWAYQRFDELVARPDITDDPPLISGQWPAEKLLVNDLEQAVLPAHPLIGKLKEKLRQGGAESALMSGSGSAVFGMFSDRSVAEKAANSLEKLGKTFVVEHLNEL